MSLDKFLDPYDVRARLFPMLVVLMPLALGLSCWLSALDSEPLLGGAVIGLALAVLLSQLARDMGRKKESYLFERWQGVPSVIALSYRGKMFDQSSLRRFHRRLLLLDKTLDFPDNGEVESERWEHFEAVYRSANELLLGRTRDREKFRLVFEENINYGLRRNLWAMKGAGLVSSIVGATLGVLSLLASVGEELPALTAISIVVGVVLFPIWVLRITPSWVRTAANAYAKQLVGSSDIIE